jgi:hypothetical protein
VSRLVDVVTTLASAGPGATIYAFPPFTPELEAAEDDESRGSADLAYLLEAEGARDLLAVWSAWRAGRPPTAEEVVKAVIYYAERDTYEPVE